MIIIKILKIKVTENVIFSFAALIFVMKTFLEYDGRGCSGTLSEFPYDEQMSWFGAWFYVQAPFRIRKRSWDFSASSHGSPVPGGR